MIDVGVAGEADAGQDGPAARHLLAVEADPVGQTQPEVEPRLAPRLVAVVVADAADPHAAEGRIFRLGQDDGVLDGDARLVVVAVQHPLLELELGQPALVHEHVVPMVIVVALLSLAADPGDELVARQRGPYRHRVTSMPSAAISHPAASATARSLQSSRSMGLVLLMWM